ncbi:hypothetical protein AMTR_s00167p00027460, partial [Amborella trichopoda]
KLHKNLASFLAGRFFPRRDDIQGIECWGQDFWKESNLGCRKLFDSSIPFSFPSESTTQRALQSTTPRFKGASLSLIAWSPDLSASKKHHIWAIFSHIPLHLWHPTTFNALGDRLGADHNPSLAKVAAPGNPSHPLHSFRLAFQGDHRIITDLIATRGPNQSHVDVSPIALPQSLSPNRSPNTSVISLPHLRYSMQKVASCLHLCSLLGHACAMFCPFQPTSWQHAIHLSTPSCTSLWKCCRPYPLTRNPTQAIPSLIQLNGDDTLLIRHAGPSSPSSLSSPHPTPSPSSSTLLALTPKHSNQRSCTYPPGWLGASGTPATYVNPDSLSFISQAYAFLPPKNHQNSP